MRARLGVIPAAILLAALAALAQRFGGGIRHGDEGPRPEFPSGAEFHFIRTEYTDLPQYHRRFDSPRAALPVRVGGWWIGPTPMSTFPWASAASRAFIPATRVTCA